MAVSQVCVPLLCCCRYAIREGTSRVKIFKNFKEKKAFKPEFGAESIFGGHLLGVNSGSHLSFYDWESLELIRRVEIAVKHVSTPHSSPLTPHPSLSLFTHHHSLSPFTLHWFPQHTHTHTHTHTLTHSHPHTLTGVLE